MPNSAWPGSAAFEGALAALRPAQRQLHGAFDLGAFGRKRDAFVELHGDVGAEQDLHFDGAFRRQFDHGAVEMRAERDARPPSLCASADSDITCKPPESVRIGSGQRMNVCSPPSAATRSAPGPQHQVIGVAEQDIGARSADIVMVHALDRRLRADRHESGRAHHAVRGRYLAGARGAIGGDQAEGEWLRMVSLI